MPSAPRPPDAIHPVAALLSQDAAALEACRAAVLASQGQGERELVAAVEHQVATDPVAAITFDGTGLATVRGAGRALVAGRFGTPSIGALERRLVRRADEDLGTRRIRLSAMLGTGPLADIGTLQAFAAEHTLFQVASQFNCLEAPDPGVVCVADYLHDPTQGPRASISAFPGVLLRHYAAPAAEGGRFVQTEARQIDLLADALPPEAGRVRGGYLQVSHLRDVAVAAEALEARFASIRVGLHDGIEVVLGHGWDGGVTGERRVAQVLTSTLAAGGYSPGVPIEGAVARLCEQLLRAAYLGTLLGACVLGKRRVVLTLIGGGVFGNPHALIWKSICWAVDRCEALAPAPLEVVVNARVLDRSIRPQQLGEDCAARGGAHVYQPGG